MTTTPVRVSVRPDREFRNNLIASGGEDLKKCFQCATCSVVCELSDATKPFPRKEMIWAQWGLKDRLIADPDVWLCHQCNDCSLRCPRGARPGDVMAAIRREAILHYGAPRWLGNWVNEPRFLPILLLFPCLLLGLAAWVRGPLERYFGASYTPNHIVISYWSQLPQWLLIVFFVPFVLMDVVVLALGMMRFWRDLKACDREAGYTGRGQSLIGSMRSALRSIVLHEDFDRCTAERPRMNSHRLVLFGFLGLLVVDLWVLTARFNPLLRDGIAYPFNFWSPWKILANLAGGAMLIGCARMVRDRMPRTGRTGTWFAGTLLTGTWFDWTFLGLAVAAALTGFGCEILHYARVDPLRYAMYVIHLATVFALLVLLPYSKFAHMIYRAAAMVYAAHTGRQPRGGLHEAE
ncbi:MAG: quinone-interacting membrane-bound oxidoreductase complex subunit QmoC [Terriglobales bacterium]|jgi:quinone-modifying oxidoreductase subunit QmoC